VLLTGATGYIGGTVLQTLLGNGHRVRAAVRNEPSAAAVTQAGAEATLGDITDVRWLTEHLVDAAISPGYPRSRWQRRSAGRRIRRVPGVDQAHSAACGSAAATRTSPRTARRGRPRSAPGGCRATNGSSARGYVPRSSVGPGVQVRKWDSRAGCSPSAPRTDDGALRLVGSGAQHCASVHVEDLADLYVAALERARVANGTSARPVSTRACARWA
jgi:hypothetical protein